MTNATATHLATARRLLLQARHYLIWFGQPIAAFPPSLNESRAAANARAVAAYARSAGQYAAYAGVPATDLADICPAATASQPILSAAVSGYLQTARLLAEAV